MAELAVVEERETPKDGGVVAIVPEFRQNCVCAIMS